MAKSKEEDTLNLTDFIISVNRQFGDGSVMTENSRVEIDKCSFGITSLDLASGGGSGVGKWLEVFGAESAGKTTLSILSMIEYQKKFPEKAVSILDFEHSFDITYARNLGLDTTSRRFVISQPDNGEQGFDIAEKMIDSGLFSLIVVDSVAAAQPKAIINGESGDATMGAHARLIGKVCAKLKGRSNKMNVSMIWINQLREKIVMFGNPETTTGGNALRFYFEQRIRLKKSEKEASTEGKIDVIARFLKNKIAVPFKEAEYSIFFGKGIDKIQDLFNVSLELGAIEKTGNTYFIDGVKLDVGKEKSLNVLRDNIELTQALDSQIKDFLEIKV